MINNSIVGFKSAKSLLTVQNMTTAKNWRDTLKVVNTHDGKKVFDDICRAPAMK